MKKSILMTVLVLVLMLGPGIAAALAGGPANTAEAWAQIAGKYAGYPFVTVEKDNLLFNVIYDKENPDLENPVAMDVRTNEGVPVLFFEYENKEAKLVWRHPAIESQWIAL